MANTGTKFTAGPWSIGGDIIASGTVRNNVWSKTPPGMQSGDMVCQLAKPADARLIVCAPELYEIARQVAEHFEYTDAPLGKLARETLARIES